MSNLSSTLRVLCGFGETQPSTHTHTQYIFHGPTHSTNTMDSFRIVFLSSDYHLQAGLVVFP